MVKDLFRKALKLMLEDGEFARLIAFCKSKRERKLIEHDFKVLTTLAEKVDIEDMPLSAYTLELKSVETFKDVVSYMVMVEGRLIKGERNG